MRSGTLHHHPTVLFHVYLFLSVYDVCSTLFIVVLAPTVKKMTRCSCLAGFLTARVILSSPLVEVIDIAALVELLDQLIGESQAWRSRLASFLPRELNEIDSLHGWILFLGAKCFSQQLQSLQDIPFTCHGSIFLRTCREVSLSV